jgi:hypothetical protein
MRIEEIKYKHIIGYCIFWIHLILVCILNFGWLIITNVIYLHILLFSQLSVLLSWRVCDGKCIMSTIEKSLLDHDDEFDSLTTRVVSNYLPERVVAIVLTTSLIVAALITLLKIAYTKMNTVTIDDLYL